MTYSKDLPSAARRHLKAAHVLYQSTMPGTQPGCQAVAGYLFGLAGELALKELMRQKLGMKPFDEDAMKRPKPGESDPFYEHFPALRTSLNSTNTLQGRRAAELRPILSQEGLFQQWDTKMRYAPTAEIQANWVSAWKKSAEELVNQMDAL